MNKIPHIIHYCWFGGKPLPEQYSRYIETWKKYFPDYEIIKWDENNFPINEFDYAKEAFQAGKMAFVSDVARIYALYEMGGIYFDTDVEVVKDFKEILDKKAAVLGVEKEYETMGTGFMAFSAKHPICNEMMNYYKIHTFENQSESMSNTLIMANLIKKKYAIELENKIQILDDLIIYPSCYFTAYNGYLGINKAVKETCCIHHFAASWHSPSRRVKDSIKKCWHRIINVFRRI